MVGTHSESKSVEIYMCVIVLSSGCHGDLQSSHSGSRIKVSENIQTEKLTRLNSSVPVQRPLWESGNILLFKIYNHFPFLERFKNNTTKVLYTRQKHQF